MQETDKRPSRHKNYFVLSDFAIVAQAQNWRDDPEQMLKDVGACVDRVQESVTLTEDYKILPPFDPDTLSHLDLRQDIERASQSLRIVDPTCLLLRELAIALGELRLEISGTEALPSGVLESLFDRIVGGLRERRLLQAASKSRKTLAPPMPPAEPQNVYTGGIPKAFLCHVLDDVSDKSLQGQVKRYGIRLHPDDQLPNRKQKLRLEIESLSNTRLYKEEERASLLLNWERDTKGKRTRKKKTD